ncbi:roundabout homolog 1 isoform X5 [Lates japonicus]|uniref:Roundabout homolog 1 isoform X5 n=1 Tax=Lates japonicus TaxID=270547 RepID=A0AAD3RL21_LATJO|nr:roundabout homolog 1 isoform X5 [Lates japonicus]
MLELQSACEAIAFRGIIPIPQEEGGVPVHSPWPLTLCCSPPVQALEAGMASGWVPLLLLVVLAEVLSGVCVPGDGSGKYKGSWRWKGDRSRE